MHVLQRNRLAWLSASAWRQVMARQWDSQAQSILSHWQTQQLPLVLCTQRVQQTPPTISLGLPGPTQWARRKLALEVAPSDIQHVNTFPLLEHIAPTEFSDAALRAFLQYMHGLRVPLQVYGSYGWQHLTGMAYVHPASDIDVIAQVPDLVVATLVARALQALQSPIRVDGELAFPNGHAISWREYLQWIDGKAERVLVRSRTQIQLTNQLVLNAEEAACSL
jgi:phosphoribosyl-dephospho-CoA transferase